MMNVTATTDNPPKRGEPHDEFAKHLRQPLERLRRTTGAGLTFAGRIVEGTDNLELFAFDGDVVGPLRGAMVDLGHGLGGRALRRRSSIAVHDYVRSPLITHTYDAIIRAESLRAMVAAPIIVGRKHIGVLYAARRNPHEELGVPLDAVTDEARRVEQQLAVADVLATLRTDDEERDIAAWRARVQESHARLRTLAGTTSDNALRAQLLEIADTLADDAPESEPAVHLTAREQDVLGLIAAGLPNAAVAEHLGIGVYTVKDHVKRLLVKLDASTRFEAVVKARRLRLTI